MAMLLLLTSILCAGINQHPREESATWQAKAGGAEIRVSLAASNWNDSAISDGPYSIYFDTEEYLRGLAPAVHCQNKWHTTMDKSLEWQGVSITNGTDEGDLENGGWGDYTRVNISWALVPSGIVLHTSISVYHMLDVFAFDQEIGGNVDCTLANSSELPSNASTTLYPDAHAALAPSIEFPAFAAPEGNNTQTRLSSNLLGYATTGGVMTYTDMGQGIGLNGYNGGMRDGPLVLFDVNKTQGDANSLVLSPGNHFTSSLISKRRSCGRQEWRNKKLPLNFSTIYNKDFKGNDLGSIENKTLQQCADACLATPQCSVFSWVPANDPVIPQKCFLKHSTAGNAPDSKHISGVYCTDLLDQTALVAGPTQYLQEIKVGTSFKYILVPQAGKGITASIDKWGKAMRSAYSLQRKPALATDEVASSLSYWTDNGAVYDGRQPLNTTMSAILFKELRTKHIPVRYEQLDPYWYSSTHAWTPRNDLYPNGLADYSQQIGIKLLLYHNFWDRDTQYIYSKNFSQDYTFLPSFSFLNRDRPLTIFQIDPMQSTQFYMDIYAPYMKAGVMMASEVDFLNWSQLTVPALFAQLDGGHLFLKGMAEAALQNGISHQLCMSLPAQILDTLLLPSVTNARASPDNTPTNEDRWKIAYTSMFMWPLEVAPFFDNIWTMANQSDQPYGPGVVRHNIELQVIINVLTAGPVGIGDQIGMTNATLAMMTCSIAGKLLQPTKPATPIDAMYSPEPPFCPSGEIWQTHTQIGSISWHYILAVDVNPGYSLTREHLYPQPNTQDYALVHWRDRESCTSSSCFSLWRANQSLDVITPGHPTTPDHAYDLILAAPLLAPSTLGSSTPSIALLGELDKVTSVSTWRFPNITVTNQGVTVTMQGAPDEHVDVYYIVFNSSHVDGTLMKTTAIVNPSLNQTVLTLPF
eukprot:m.4153 g.4153  ORF g.4153 m.4153 type:complete len:922 (-) comp2906_c0_seq1:25-2790(-)